MIDSVRRRDITPDAPDLAPPPPRADATARRELLEPDYPESPPLLLASIGLCATNAVDARPPSSGEKLDELAASYAGPYQVDKQTVSVPVMFKMLHGYASQTRAGELASIVGKDLAGVVQGGQAKPEQIKQATQMLIDASKLPAGPGDVASRIKTMQWQYGIGIDCACYTHKALLAVTGKSDDQLGLAGWDDFRHLDTNRHFQKVTPENVVTGDVITLDPKPPEIVGHNVIVRSAFGTDSYPDMTGPGPYRVITVDSSWGAGDKGSLTGGYRRDTWIYDESTKEWGHTRLGSTDLVVSPDGPADWDKLHGAYRVKP